jgi:hypothetical protein
MTFLSTSSAPQNRTEEVARRKTFYENILQIFGILI